MLKIYFQLNLIHQWKHETLLKDLKSESVVNDIREIRYRPFDCGMYVCCNNSLVDREQDQSHAKSSKKKDNNASW
jgi:hypothetical protein